MAAPARTLDALKERGVLVHPLGPQSLRACTHLDVSAAQAARAAEIIRQVVPRLRGVSPAGAAAVAVG